MALNGFAPAAYGSMSAGQGSSSAAIPGGATGPTLLITNLGPAPAFILLSTDPTTVVTSATGVPVQPGQSLALTVGDGTYISAIANGFGSAWLSLVSGT
jgi:hypothetical protein